MRISSLNVHSTAHYVDLRKLPVRDHHDIRHFDVKGTRRGRRVSPNHAITKAGKVGDIAKGDKAMQTKNNTVRREARAVNDHDLSGV